MFQFIQMFCIQSSNKNWDYMVESNSFWSLFKYIMIYIVYRDIAQKNIVILCFLHIAQPYLKGHTVPALTSVQAYMCFLEFLKVEREAESRSCQNGVLSHHLLQVLLTGDHLIVEVSAVKFLFIRTSIL